MKVEIGEYITDNTGVPHLVKDILCVKEKLIEVDIPGKIVFLDERTQRTHDYHWYSDVIRNLKNKIWFKCDNVGRLLK